MLNLLISLSFFVNAMAGSFPIVDNIIEKGIEEKVLPGGVLFAEVNGTTVIKSSYGTIDGESEVSFNIIYDLASLTKVIATATSIMILEEQRKLKISDKLSSYYLDFQTEEKKNITIEDLLRHRSGLPASTKIVLGESYEQFIKRILKAPLQYEPGRDVVYSDIGFVILGDLVQKISGTSLQEFTKTHIYLPLKMNQTGYFVENCAPTSMKMGCMPHDPKAMAQYPNNLGHAGVFSTLDDCCKICENVPS